MDLMKKLEILAASARYDVACTSSGTERKGSKGGVGSAMGCGICHSFSADGRCISLLKILMTNVCAFDCQYCANRSSADIERATFTPEEIAGLTINFYRRNYIEGLFLSSAVLKSPDYTMERLISTLTLIREKYTFNGYIHVKSIPGADKALIDRLCGLADRVSVNIEMPTAGSLALLAPQKDRDKILMPMRYISGRINEYNYEKALYKNAESFAPAGQSTQLIIGATPESDQKIITLSESLYSKFLLKRVFYSAYVPVGIHPALPSTDTKPPLLREHRLYQADFLLRFYGFKAKELLQEDESFDVFLDPKCDWALRNMQFFPVEINKADYYMLLRAPGIGTRSAKRIIAARKISKITFAGLKSIGVVLKRARFFVTCDGKYMDGLGMNPVGIKVNLMADKTMTPDFADGSIQLSIFDHLFSAEDTHERGFAHEEGVGGDRLIKIKETDLPYFLPESMFIPEKIPEKIPGAVKQEKGQEQWITDQ